MANSYRKPNTQRLQRDFFEFIGKTSGIQLWLGHLVERPVGTFQQKGVDTLLTLDLVRFAGRSVCSTAVLVVTDHDFSEAIWAAHDFGIRVLVIRRTATGLCAKFRN